MTTDIQWQLICMRQLPWRRKWQPTPVFLPGEFHWQRSLAGWSPWGRKELDISAGLSLTHSSTLLSILTGVIWQHELHRKRRVRGLSDTVQLTASKWQVLISLRSIPINYWPAWLSQCAPGLKLSLQPLQVKLHCNWGLYMGFQQNHK